MKLPTEGAIEHVWRAQTCFGLSMDNRHIHEVIKPRAGWRGCCIELRRALQSEVSRDSVLGAECTVRECVYICIYSINTIELWEAVFARPEACMLLRAAPRPFVIIHERGGTPTLV